MEEWRDRAKRRMAQLHPPVPQRELMEVFGVQTRGAVGHYLGGRNDPPIETLAPLADKLQMSLDELLRGTASQSRSQPARLTGEMILSAYQEAVVKVEALGITSREFNPFSDPDHAGLLAMALTAHMTQPPADSRILVDVEVGNGSSGKDRTRGGAAGEDRPQEAEREGKSKARHRKEHAA